MDPAGGDRADAHADLERVLGEERLDLLQVNYSLAERDAETRLLPFCRDHGIALMANRPFADGGMVARVKDRPLPDWAAEIGCTSWAQFFLKYVLSHPAVTCAIPATARARHMQDKCAGGLAPLPDEKQRARMADVWAALGSKERSAGDGCWRAKSAARRAQLRGGGGSARKL